MENIVDGRRQAVLFPIEHVKVADACEKRTYRTDSMPY